MPYQQNGNQGSQKHRQRQANYTLNRTQARTPSVKQPVQSSRPAYVQPEIHIHLDGSMPMEKKKGFSVSTVLYALMAIACCAAAVYLFVSI